MPSKRADEVIYQIRVELGSIEPVIWRRFLVPSSITLHRLHLVLQEVMGWSNYHLYRFRIGGKEYGELDPDDEAYGLHFINSRRARLGRGALAEGESFTYEYDFGDGWVHRLVVESIREQDARAIYPVCLEGKRACPPEDCGGPHEYVRFLGIVANPDHEQYEEMKLWLGRRFRPDDFSLAKVNRRLRSI